MPDIHFHSYVFHTPAGPITVLYQEQPFCLKQVCLPRESSLPCQDCLRQEEVPRNHPVREVSHVIISYFKGQPFEPVWKYMPMDAFTDLQKAVLYETAVIPFGHVRTYKDIAVAVKRPRACRFVGTTLANNPYPILIPCHRVIRRDGKIGGFGGGSALKQYLIDFEKKHSR